MKIHVIGPGVVGRATGEGFRRFGHEVIYTDVGGMFPSDKQDLNIICVPEKEVPGVVHKLSVWLSNHVQPNEAIIRSSVVPRTTERLSSQHDMNLWHNPEFLKELTAEQDFLTQPYAIIGGIPTNSGLALELLYKSMDKEVIWCSPTESELAKLITNVYLATQISFWNEMKKFADAAKVNSHTVARLVSLDSRVSHYGAYMHGSPYGGRCLPKDVQQLLSLELDTPLLNAVKSINNSLGGQ